jgi:hypothetical protein
MTRTRNNILVTLGPQGLWLMLYTRFGLTLCWLKVGSQQNCDTRRDAVHTVLRGVNLISAVWSLRDAVFPSRMNELGLFCVRIILMCMSQMQGILRSGFLYRRDVSWQDRRLHASSSAFECGNNLLSHKPSTLPQHTFFWSKIAIFSSLGLVKKASKLQKKPSALEREYPALQTMKIINFSNFFGSFLPSWIRILDPKHCCSSYTTCIYLWYHNMGNVWVKDFVHI